VDTVLVVGASVAGLVGGGLLDPWGQRLAARSHALDEARRADRARRTATDDAGVGASDGASDGAIEGAIGASDGATPADRSTPGTQVGMTHGPEAGPAVVTTNGPAPAATAAPTATAGPAGPAAVPSLRSQRVPVPVPDLGGTAAAVPTADRSVPSAPGGTVVASSVEHDPVTATVGPPASRSSDATVPAANRAADADADADTRGLVEDDTEPAVPHLLPQGTSGFRTAGSAVVTGALAAAVAARFGPHLATAALGVFVAVLVAVAVTDLSWRLVPRQLIYGGLVGVAVLDAADSVRNHDWTPFVHAAVAGGVSFAVFFAVWWFAPRGLGFGDVRLAGLIGFATGFLGPVHAYLAFAVGFVVGLLVGLVVMAVTTAGRRTRIPFAPALAVGATVAVFFGTPLGHALFHAGG
jgi:leader peptidase (prepilin peptidase)/N-methyltransferase